MFDILNRKKVTRLENENHYLHQSLFEQRKEYLRVKEVLKKRPSFEYLMDEAMGISIDFSAADEKCLPVHYLTGLSEEEHKNFVIDIELIYSNERFKKIVAYMINLFALGMVYKADEDARKNHQAAVVALRTFLRELKTLHNEFEGYKKADEPFDPLAALPE